MPGPDGEDGCAYNTRAYEGRLEAEESLPIWSSLSCSYSALESAGEDYWRAVFWVTLWPLYPIVGLPFIVLLVQALVRTTGRAKVSKEGVAKSADMAYLYLEMADERLVEIEEMAIANLANKRLSLETLQSEVAGIVKRAINEEPPVGILFDLGARIETETQSLLSTEADWVMEQIRSGDPGWVLIDEQPGLGGLIQPETISSDVQVLRLVGQEEVRVTSDQQAKERVREFIGGLK